MISAPLKALLDVIREHEAPKGYGQIYSGAKGVPRDTDISKYTLNGVLDFQTRMLRAGSLSTACGGYQFLRKTLIATMAGMGLTGTELWDEDLQDRMASHLIENRGLPGYLAGQLTREAFANNLAKEWASLPVVTAIRGANRELAIGETYYAGDGLNKAFHKPETILALIDAIRWPPQRPVQPVPLNGAIAARPLPAPAPVAPTPGPVPQPVAVKRSWWAWLFNRA